MSKLTTEPRLSLTRVVSSTIQMRLPLAKIRLAMTPKISFSISAFIMPDSKESFEQTFLALISSYSLKTLPALKPRLEAAVTKKHGDVELKKLNELKTDSKVVVLGTLIKNYKNQPSVLKTLAQGDTDMNGGIKQEQKEGKKYSDEDEMFLEDGTQ